MFQPKTMALLRGLFAKDSEGRVYLRLADVAPEGELTNAVNTQSSQNTQLRSVESSELLTSDTSSFSEAASRDTKIPQTDDSRQNRRREQRLEQGRRRNDDDDDDAAANFEQLTANDRRLPASERSQRNSAASIKGRRTFEQLERNSYS